MFIFVVAVAALVGFIIYLKRKTQEPYVVIRKETVSMNQDEDAWPLNQTGTNMKQLESSSYIKGRGGAAEQTFPNGATLLKWIGGKVLLADCKKLHSNEAWSAR